MVKGQNSSSDGKSQFQIPWVAAFFNLTQVAICKGQEAENEFKVRCYNYNHRFIELS